MTRPILALALASFFLAACNDIPKDPGAGIRTSDKQAVTDRAPIEVAVAPVVNASGASMPMRELRESFQKELVVRRYSPLALEYVDRKVVDAAYTPGASQESATLLITAEKWDTSLWTTHGAISTRMTVSLLDAKDAGKVLWSATTDRRYDFLRQREQLTTETARMKMACDSIAQELLARLPARTARPGRTTPE